ncbi:NUDIX domain-containing protein [Aestuariivirga sp. YIM B02566]|uniref:NUDIX domain-containing protein n=1 Tax=Taklimakanibacter albus TaxID=2800327 RepID=A0ACC5R4F5_9HYPH|nr:NUDIX domain-containing protein [Aestuariivirga sp. YIM B02566]MBK1867509.1 NUDIX domain-containing protein [Aestuariivirga sp. YIM B02566]
MLSRILIRVLQPWFRLRRGMTLGVRIVVLDDANRVFLVRHGYAPGWLLPGGGVERGQTFYDAVERELAEEGGIVPDERPVLHGLFSNEAKFRGDHVACFVLRKFTRKDWTPTLEIREAGFFPVADLPEGTTGGTRRRIAEVLEGRTPLANW